MFSLKRLIILFFFIPVIAKAQQASPNAVIKEFIASIKTGDTARYIKLFPGIDVMKKIVNEEVNDSLFIGEGPYNMEREGRVMFGEINMKLKNAKIDPAQLTMGAVKLVKKNEQGRTVYEAEVAVTAGGKKHILEVYDVLQYKNAYYGINLRRVKPPR